MYGGFLYSATKVSTESNENSPFPQSSNLWPFIYILILTLGNYFINLNITTEICGETQWGNTLLITLVPWLLIFSIIVIVLIICVSPNIICPGPSTSGKYGTPSQNDSLYDNTCVLENISCSLVFPACSNLTILVAGRLSALPLLPTRSKLL